VTVPVLRCLWRHDGRTARNNFAVSALVSRHAAFAPKPAGDQFPTSRPNCRSVRAPCKSVWRKTSGWGPSH